MSPSDHGSTSMLAHELVGAEGQPTLLVLGGISASRHVSASDTGEAPGWWSDIAGPERALDTRRWRLLSIEYLAGGRAPNGRPARIVTTHDQAEAIVALLDDLKIDRLDAVVGASYGGMVALSLAERWPDRVRRAVVISAAHESWPMSTALRALQRRIVELGLETGRPFEGMTLARALAMTTYRTPTELSSRFGLEATRGGTDASFEIERYLLHAGERYAERTAPERFLALSLSADLHRVVPERVMVPTTIVAAQGDTLVPAAQTRELARRLPLLTSRVTLRSHVGHDAFLVEPKRLTAILNAALEG